MKISCQSCQAKYTIADEKVLGKIVKIRCKKCGATIVINGNEQESTQAYDTGAAQQPVDYASQQGGEPWTVNVSDGDQRSMTLPELVAAYQAGTVNDETYCWKDGMADWLPVREIPEISAAVAGGGGAALPPAAAGGGYQEHQSDDQPTQAGFSSLFGGGGGAAQPQNGGASLFGGGAAAPQTAASTAARRAGGRGGGGADLFGSVAQAGGEQDVMTSAQANPQPAPAGEDKMTGSRNENSVLFSLAALTSNAPEKKNDTPMAQGEGSGLIDIRALSASMENKPSGPKKVDDIMNLSGGGAFSAALAAPVLAPPPADAVDYGGGGEKKKGNATLLIGIIAGFAIVGVLAAGGVYLALKSGNSGSTAATATSTASAAPTATATDTAASTGPVAMNDTNTASTTTAARPGVGETHSGAKPATGGGGETHTGGGGGGGGGGVVIPAPQSNTGGCAPGDLQCAMAKSAGQAPPPANTGGGGGGGSSPFNPGNAAAALGPIAASVGSCKRADGPTGGGHAKITFSPSGNVSSVEIDGGPFPGTAVGGCVAGKFRGAHIAPFSGGPVTVGKSFSI